MTRLAWPLLALLLAACGSSPVTRYHSLHDDAPVGGGGSAERLVEVLPVTVPAAVDRPELVLIGDDGGLALFRPEQTLEGFRTALRWGVDAVICNHVSNVFGCVQPVEELAGLCRRTHTPFIVDASQSAGIRSSDSGSAALMRVETSISIDLSAATSKRDPHFGTRRITNRRFWQCTLRTGSARRRYDAARIYLQSRRAQTPYLQFARFLCIPTKMFSSERFINSRH